MVMGCQYGLGRHSYYVGYEDQVTANFFNFLSQPIAVWAVCFAKCSVACVLLRIKQTPGWRIFLYIAIAFQVASAIVSTVVVFVQCVPLSALW